MEPESVNPYLLAIRKRNRRILLATILVFVVPLGLVGRSCTLSVSHGYRNFENRLFDPERYEHPLTAEQRAAILAALDTTRARADEARKSWRVAVDAAMIAGLTGRPDLGRCPIPVSDPGKSTGSYPTAPWWMTIARTPGEVMTAQPARWATYEREIKRHEVRAADSYTDRGAVAAVKEAQDFAKIDRWTWDVLMIIDKRVEPKGLTGGEGFVSGEVEGRAYLYDYHAGAITCAGRVHAENSDEVRFKYTRRLGSTDLGAGSYERVTALERDLEVESHRAAAAAVHDRAGPPLLLEP
jgi:hypothetical protein